MHWVEYINPARNECVLFVTQLFPVEEINGSSLPTVPSVALAEGCLKPVASLKRAKNQSALLPFGTLSSFALSCRAFLA